MSYQVLARKWRPSTFAQMVGQEHVLKALVNALDSGRLHHAYLFTGTRGVGKTSIARLFAKALNCEQGVSSEPCGECTACRGISEGRFVDLIEVDAASRTKVEDTRELLDNVQYAPTQGRYKVYLIDEVHMLSGHSFNALLKTLEEPPPHIKFLLATTDPQKLPVTILSRCLQFNLKNMTPERIVGHLQHILQAEQVSHDEPALWLLSRAANGSMRDALSLTDQAIAFGSGQLQETDVRAMLGSVDQQHVLQLLSQVAASDAAGVMEQVAAIAEYGVDFEDVLAELINLLHRVAVAQMLPDAIDNSLGDRDAVLALARALNAEDTQLFYQIALNGRKDLPQVPVPRNGFEMTLLRMLAFRPVTPGDVAIPTMASGSAEADAGDEQLSGHPEAGAAVSSPEPAVHEHALQDPPLPLPLQEQEPPVQEPSLQEPQPLAHQAPAAAYAQDDSAQPQHDISSQDHASEDYGSQSYASQSYVSQSDAPDSGPGYPDANDAAPPEYPPHDYDDRPPEPSVVADRAMDAPPWDHQPVEQPPISESPAKKAQPPERAIPDAGSGEPKQVRPEAASLPEGFTLNQLDGHHWLALCEVIELSGMTYNIAANATVQGVAGNTVEFVLPARQYHLFNGTHQQRIEQALSAYFDQSVAVRFEEGDSPVATPAEHKERLRQQRLAQAVDALQSDTQVQAIVEHFGAVVDVNSIRPIEPK